MRLVAYSLFLLATLSGSVFAEPTKYECAATHVAGLKYDFSRNDWKPVTFRSGDRYVFQIIPESEYNLYGNSGDLHSSIWEDLTSFSGNNVKSLWRLTKEDKLAWPILICARYFLETDKATFGPNYECKPYLGLAQAGGFDEASGRFEYSQSQSYVAQAQMESYRRLNPDQYQKNKANGTALDPDHPDDMFIVIGMCSPF